MVPHMSMHLVGILKSFFLSHFSSPISYSNAIHICVVNDIGPTFWLLTQNHHMSYQISQNIIQNFPMTLLAQESQRKVFQSPYGPITQYDHLGDQKFLGMYHTCIEMSFH